MYDTMNTYNLAFIIMASAYVIAISAVLAVRRPKSFARNSLQEVEDSP
jgi:hypothetical protein